MNKLNFVFLCLSCLPAVLLKGQGITRYDCDSVLISITEPKLFGDLYQQKNIGIGSQYYIEDWLNGDVYLSNKCVVKNQYLRYNGFLDRLMWFTPGTHQQVKLDKEQIEGFCLNSRTGKDYCYEKIIIKEELIFDSVAVFAEVLYKSDISLYAYRKIDIVGYHVVSRGSKYMDIYKLENTYFLKLENGKTLGFKKFGKHNIYKLFPDKKALISSRFKKSKLRHIWTEDDLILAAQDLNEIL